MGATSIGTPVAVPVLRCSDTWAAIATVPTGKTWIVSEVSAANMSNTSNPVSLRYLDASDGNAPTNIAPNFPLATNTTDAMLTVAKFLNAGDVLQGKCTTSAYGTKSNTMGASMAARAMAYDGTTLMVVGTVGQVATTTDLGDNWTTLDLGTASTLSALASGATGEFVTHDGANFRSSSNSGSSFTTRTAATFTCNRIIWCTALSLYIAVGTGGNIWTAPAGGVTWTQRTSSVSVTLNDVAFNGTTALAVGAVAPTNGASCTTTDGITWVAQNSGTAQSFLAVGYCSGLAAFMVSLANKAYSTTDGITYTARQDPASGTTVGVVSNGTEFATFTSSGASTYSALAATAVTRTPSTAPNQMKPIYAASKYIWASASFIYTCPSFNAAGSMAVDMSPSIVEVSA